MEKEPENISKLKTPLTIKEDLTGEVEIPTARVLDGVRSELPLVGAMLKTMSDEDWEEAFDVLSDVQDGLRVIK